MGATKDISFFVFNQDIEKNVESILAEIFAQYGKVEYTGIIFTCVKELIINAVKANLKRVLFEEHKMNIDDEKEYLAGMLRFRNELNTLNILNYESKLKSKNYWVKISVEHSVDGICIEVTNNAHITRIEEQRLREKLRKAMQYTDIAQFYMEQGDEIEGAGMGIALVIMLLKGLGVDPSLFRLGNTNEDNTLIRLEIPFTKNYVSKRDVGVH